MVFVAWSPAARSRARETIKYSKYIMIMFIVYVFCTALSKWLKLSLEQETCAWHDMCTFWEGCCLVFDGLHDCKDVWHTDRHSLPNCRNVYCAYMQLLLIRPHISHTWDTNVLWHIRSDIYGPTAPLYKTCLSPYAKKHEVLYPARILAEVLASAFCYNRDGVQAHQWHGAR